MPKFKLGNRLRDRVSGIEGITTGYVTYLNGCRQWNIHPKAGDDGKYIDSQYYDEQQLEFVDDGIAKTGAKTNCDDSTTGGAPTMVRSAR